MDLGEYPRPYLSYQSFAYFLEFVEINKRFSLFLI